MKNKLTILIIVVSTAVFSQNQTQGVSIANNGVPPSKDAILDVVSTNKGMLVPRVDYSELITGNLTPVNVMSDPSQHGLLVFVINQGNNYGYWYFDFYETTQGQTGAWKKISGNTGGNLWSKRIDNDDIYNSFLQDNIGIGTNSPTHKLTVSNGSIKVKATEAHSPEIHIGEVVDALGGHNNEINCYNAPLDLQFSNGQGVRIGRNEASSDLRVYGTVYYWQLQNFSDSTLKENIITSRIALNLGSYSSNNNFCSKIDQIKTYKYNYKNDTKKSPNYGVMAQEIKLIFPDLVNTETYTVNKGENPVNESFMSVNYQGLIAILIEAVKEQNAMFYDKQQTIDSLNNRITTLENQYSDLLNRVIVLESN